MSHLFGVWKKSTIKLILPSYKNKLLKRMLMRTKYLIKMK